MSHAPVECRLESTALLALVHHLLDRILEPVHARDQLRDVLGGRDRRADVHPREQRDVVDGEHVRRIGHREQHRAVVDREGSRGADMPA